MTESQQSPRRPRNAGAHPGGGFLSRPAAAIAAGVVALVVIAAAAFALVFALDGDEDDGGSSDDGAPPVEQARAVIPDLSEHGFEPSRTGDVPFVPESIGTARALYESTGNDGDKIIVEAYVYPSSSQAEAEYPRLVEALAEAPIGTVLANPLDPELGDTTSGPPAFMEGAGPDLADQHDSFVTREPDSNDNHVTADTYRQGRLIAVVRVLASADSDHMDLRTSIAEEVFSRFESL